MNSEGNWSFEAVQSLVALAREGVPVSVISLKLKRSITDVRAKLSDLGITPPAEA
jgi:Fe2+ transport system protein FeoA